MTEPAAGSTPAPRKTKTPTVQVDDLKAQLQRAFDAALKKRNNARRLKLRHATEEESAEQALTEIRGMAQAGGVTLVGDPDIQSAPQPRPVAPTRRRLGKQPPAEPVDSGETRTLSILEPDQGVNPPSSPPAQPSWFERRKAKFKKMLTQFIDANRPPSRDAEEGDNNA